MQKLNTKRIFNLFLVFLAYIVCGIITKGEHKYLILLFQIILVTLAFYFDSKKRIKELKFSIYIFLVILITAIIVTNDFKRLGVYLLVTPLIYYLALKLKNIKKTLTILLLTIIILFNSFISLPNYYAFSKKILKPNIKGISLEQINLIDKNGKVITLEKSKTYVLDFWTAGCKQCFVNFPKFKIIEESYIDNPSIEFYSVLVPFSRENDHLGLMRKIENKYGLKTLMAQNKEQIKDILKINAFPNYLIVTNNIVKDSHLNLDKNYVYFNNVKHVLRQYVN